jgi:hypothetical protein
VIGIAISLLWFLIGIAILCAIVYFVFYALRTILGVAIPERVEQIVWFIVLCLALIAILTILAGGSLGGMRLPHMSAMPVWSSLS